MSIYFSPNQQVEAGGISQQDAGCPKWDGEQFSLDPDDCPIVLLHSNDWWYIVDGHTGYVLCKDRNTRQPANWLSTYMVLVERELAGLTKDSEQQS